MLTTVRLRRRERSNGAAALLCEFLDGAAHGHTDESGKFYDRFKVIVRVRRLFGKPGWFLSKMINAFSGKPMLWRFFGVWGRCHRRGAAVFINMDMCTGGMLKNRAFAEGVRSGFGKVVFGAPAARGAHGSMQACRGAG